MKIKISDIDIGIPKFQWLCGRMTFAEFMIKHNDIYHLLEKPVDKIQILSDLHQRYARYLDLPLLVEKYITEEGKERYKLRDGYRRLTVINYLGVSWAIVELWKEGMTKLDWEYGRLLDIQLKKGWIIDFIPQVLDLKGPPPYDMKIKGGYVDSFLIATGVQVPYVLNKADSFKARGDDFKGKSYTKIELLLGQGNHKIILKEHGTQPLNSYLVGHFATGPDAFKDPIVKMYGRFVRVQQYFRGGCWGKDVPGYTHNGVSTVYEQLYQTKIGINLMFKLGIFDAETKIYFADQSADKPGALHEYFKLFNGEDVVKQYFDWLPTYFRTCRRDHFNISIDEVIEQVWEAWKA